MYKVYLSEYLKEIAFCSKPAEKEGVGEPCFFCLFFLRKGEVNFDKWDG